MTLLATERNGIYVGPDSPDSDWAVAAVAAGGGRPAKLTEARAVIWAASGRADRLAQLLEDATPAEWVHTAYSGVDAFAQLVDHRRVWTSGKGALARPVAEHALALMLASLRHLPAMARARVWQELEPRTLFGARVLIVGAGAVGTALAELLQPFECEVRLLNRDDTSSPKDSPTSSRLRRSLPDADVVVLAAPLTPASEGLIGAQELRLMSRDAVLVNVARGSLLRLDDLKEALDAEGIQGAALDVTDPEPLPEGHPLYSHPRCIVTSHTAVTEASGQPLLAPRITENVSRFLRGDALMGVVDPDLRY